MPGGGFPSQDLPDNGIPGIDRFRHTGRDLVRHAFDVQGKRAAGFKAMVFLPENGRSRWSDAWQALGEWEGLRVIFLERRDNMAQYASYAVARHTGIFHPSSDDPVLEADNRPRVRIDPRKFEHWQNEREQLYRLRRKQLQGKAALNLCYEELCTELG